MDLFVACFECDAHSSLSIYRQQGPGSILKGAHPTAKGVLAYLFKHRPKAWLGENVKQLASATETSPSDLDTLRSMLLEIDYELADFRVRAESHGSPAPRDRTVAASCPYRSRRIWSGHTRFFETWLVAGRGSSRVWVSERHPESGNPF